MTGRLNNTPVTQHATGPNMSSGGCANSVAEEGWQAIVPTGGQT